MGLDGEGFGAKKVGAKAATGSTSKLKTQSL